MKNSFTKKDLVQSIHKKQPHLNKDNVQMMVDIVLNEITQSLVNQQRVELRNFGIFYVKNCTARQLYNPLTQKKTILSTKKLPAFRISATVQKFLSLNLQKNKDPSPKN